ncbi:DUF1365 domain-containing protein [Hydrocarboniphaga sp.]|uniref:DUF1365 domain-containing protein n=1 Tax=Hydrocarboniphaga sp. TaxID=2033016 RepID=UPI003D0FEFED
MPLADDIGALYSATVMHRRRVAPLYRFVYRIFYLLLDIDRIDELDRGLRWFSRNRFNLLSFRDSDYGRGDNGGLRAWATGVLVDGGIDIDGGRIRLLTLPRLLGHAFNPISLWYCEHRDGRLLAVIAEVRNTFGEKHSYLLPAPASSDGGTAYQWSQHKDKCFHVSPFFDLVGRYHFELALPGEKLMLRIHETREGQPIFDASLIGEREVLSDTRIVQQVARMPWMTIKVVVGIHWQALKIWLRGARFHTKPAPPQSETS